VLTIQDAQVVQDGEKVANPWLKWWFRRVKQENMD